MNDQPSDVVGAARWASHMEAAKHRPDCRAPHRVQPPEDEAAHRRRNGLDPVVWVYPDPACTGCVTPEHRRLWRQIRRELDRHIGRPTC